MTVKNKNNKALMIELKYSCNNVMISNFYFTIKEFSILVWKYLFSTSIHKNNNKKDNKEKTRVSLIIIYLQMWSLVKLDYYSISF